LPTATATAPLVTLRCEFGMTRPQLSAVAQQRGKVRAEVSRGIGEFASGRPRMKVKEATRPTSATTRLALTFGSLVLLVVKLIRNVRMVVHELVASLGATEMPAFLLCGIRTRFQRASRAF
jgi:hypothetical protein